MKVVVDMETCIGSEEARLVRDACSCCPVEAIAGASK